MASDAVLTHPLAPIDKELPHNDRKLEKLHRVSIDEPQLPIGTEIFPLPSQDQPYPVVYLQAPFQLGLIYGVLSLIGVINSIACPKEICLGSGYEILASTLLFLCSAVAVAAMWKKSGLAYTTHRSLLAFSLLFATANIVSFSRDLKNADSGEILVNLNVEWHCAIDVEAVYRFKVGCVLAALQILVSLSQIALNATMTLLVYRERQGL